MFLKSLSVKAIQSVNAAPENLDKALNLVGVNTGAAYAGMGLGAVCFLFGVGYVVKQFRSFSDNSKTD
jgi:hypothetical protein